MSLLVGIHHFWRENPPDNGTGEKILGQHYEAESENAMYLRALAKIRMQLDPYLQTLWIAQIISPQVSIGEMKAGPQCVVFVCTSQQFMVVVILHCCLLWFSGNSPLNC